MAEPLPNCPLCNEVPAGGGSRTWCSNFDCMLSGDAIKTEAWRALAALRKPLTEQEADALVTAFDDAVNRSDSVYHPAREALMGALTGKAAP